MDNYSERTNNSHTFTGSDVNVFFGAVLASALKSYARQIEQHGKVIITMARTSPTKALEMATSYTGKKYKRGEYAKAGEEVSAFIETLKDRIVLK